MSYTTLCGVDKKGNVFDIKEYRNSWGGAAHIWTALCERYDVRDPYGYTSFEAWKMLWNKVKDKEVILRDWELLVLYFTYDNAMVSKKAFKKLADALELFYEAHTKDGMVDHTITWAKDIRNLEKDVKAVCLHATSVNSHPWMDWDEDNEEYVPYNIKNGDKHWFVDEELRV